MNTGYMLWGLTLVLLLLVALSGCSQLTPEGEWIERQRRRCLAASSRGTYIPEIKTFECWNQPMGRRPKITFKEVYNEAGK